MTVYYLLELYHSSYSNNIRKNIVKAFKNSNDLDNYILNHQIPISSTTSSTFYSKESAIVDDNCSNLFFLLNRCQVFSNWYWQDPEPFPSRNAALVHKTIFEYNKIQNNANYRIDSELELKFIPIQ